MSYSNRILTKILAMDKVQLAEFMSTLSPDMINYLEIILVKAEKNSANLKKYLDSN